MNYDKMLEERRKAIEKRYETDIVYKALVNNYIKSLHCTSVYFSFRS